MTIAFIVRGLPMPQGSHRAFVVHSKGRPRAVMTSAAKGLSAWRQAIAQEARRAMNDAALLEGPLAVTAVFGLLRPKTRPKRELWPDRRPDLDKLLRALLDACTGVIWRDDAQIVRASVEKTYSSSPGVSVEISTFQEGRD